MIRALISAFGGLLVFVGFGALILGRLGASITVSSARALAVMGGIGVAIIIGAIFIP